MLVALNTAAQVQPADSVSLFIDSLLMELPEVMVKGERPIVRAEQGKLVYDLPRLVEKLPVDNAYDAIKELPGIVDMNGGLTLAGNSVNIIINGKVTSLTPDQLAELLKSTPVSRIDKAEVMFSAPARYQVRGPMVNLVWKSDVESRPSVQGELHASWIQKHYEQFAERAGILYSSPRFSADFLYSHTHGRSYTRIDKEALHSVDGVVYPMNLSDKSQNRHNRHNARLGMDYRLAGNNTLSLIYTTQIGRSSSRGITTGTETSDTHTKGNSQLHNLKLDYQSSFGLSAGVETTYYKVPGTQELRSTLNDEYIDARYKDEQRINKWRFYLTQEHELGNGWGLNYGANYSTTVDHSFQYYYNIETGEFEAAKSMDSRRKEDTVNGFGGFNKSFGSKLSLDLSLAAEYYRTDIWNEWMLFPTLNVNYTPAPGHAFMLSLSSDKDYPAYWSMQNSISYMSAYTELHGNPDLKPEIEYRTSLTYIYKGKYVLTGFYNYDKNYSVQTLYQHPGRLVEIYKELNADFKQNFGLQATVPFAIGDRFNSRVTLVGYRSREKDSQFWETSYDRRVASFMAIANANFTLSTAKPDLRLNISGFYQNGAIQGIYDLSRSGNVDASLLWTFAAGKARLTLKCADLFDTSGITPRIRFEQQNVTNHFLDQRRSFELSFNYRFGNYKEKKRGEVDTSRFK